MISLTNETKVTYLYQDKYSSYAMPELAVHTYNSDIKNPSLLQYYDYYIQQETLLVNNGKTKSTIDTYVVRLRNMVLYLKNKKAENIHPSQITIRFIREFEYWLKSERKCGNDYTMKNIQILGRVLKLAMENGDIKNNPIDLYDFKYKRAQKRVFLEIEELEILESKKFRINRLNRIKDVYIFCCYTGLSYMDVRNFDVTKHIIHGPDRTPWISIKRHKSDRETSDGETYLPLLSTAAAILEKYGNRLPVISNRKMNAYIQEIAEILGIDKHLTTHTARKTFGNIMHNEFGVPIETVSRMLGHKSVRTTQQYYVKTSMRKVQRDMDSVKIFFSEAA